MCIRDRKCSFTMDGGTITGNTATAGNGGGIYIHFNAGNVSISNARSPATRRPPRGIQGMATGAAFIRREG